MQNPLDKGCCLWYKSLNRNGLIYTTTHRSRFHTKVSLGDFGHKSSCQSSIANKHLKEFIYEWNGDFYWLRKTEQIKRSPNCGAAYPSIISSMPKLLKRIASICFLFVCFSQMSNKTDYLIYDARTMLMSCQ